MIHSLQCTVNNEMKTNQFYEPQPYFPTDVEHIVPNSFRLHCAESEKKKNNNNK